MAIAKNEFINKVDVGIRANINYTKFLLDFRVKDKRINRVLDYTLSELSKKEKIDKVKLEKNTVKKKALNPLSDNITLNGLATIYFNLKDTNWNKELKRVYELHLQSILGNTKVVDIKAIHIDMVKKQMSTKGYSKQTSNGCSPRTIKKALVQTLKPILEYAYDNRIIDYVPRIEVKQTARKKTVLDPKGTLTKLFKSINELYREDSFYRSLFLFALYGRRLNEILTLEWEDINFNNKTYTIQAHNSKNRIQYIFGLPEPIKQALDSLQTERSGLIFKSSITGGKLSTPKKQLDKLKHYANFPELTFHLFRHILTSSLATNENVSNVMLSASLGHKDFTTVTKHYATLDYCNSSKLVNTVIDGIVVLHDY